EEEAQPAEACEEDQGWAGEEAQGWGGSEALGLGGAEAFRRDFASRVWLTYRERLPAPLPGSTLTSDCGWGCMLRAGQMMLAQALVLHFLGRDQGWAGEEAQGWGGSEALGLGGAEAFRRDFASRVWLTYRERLPVPLPGSTLTSDCGWGCMLRAGQMMLAQALVLHFLGRDQGWAGEEAQGWGGSEALGLGGAEAFRRDFASRVWLTYRERLPAPLPGSTLTSDCGWGCMLRAGQMMLAQALVLHFLGRGEPSAPRTNRHSSVDWTWPRALDLEPLDTETRTASAAKRLVASLEYSLPGSRDPRGPRSRLPSRQGPSRQGPSRQGPSQQGRGAAEEADGHRRELCHRTLVSWFGDDPGAPLGLHRLVRLGLELGKQAGDWYGPALLAHILQRAVEQATEPRLAGVTTYVSQDCTGPATAPLGSRGPATAPLDSRAVIILVPSVLSLDYCVGVLGGKRQQARYLVGFQDDSLIYMDPHYCQASVDVSSRLFPLQSFHCPSPKKMAFADMDPSCTIGFYSRSARDYERISRELSEMLCPSARDKYPAFSVVAGHAGDHHHHPPPTTSTPPAA
ncbi:hypothetical protein CRUP_034577, partial [Coryphaenoides rupestris]